MRTTIPTNAGNRWITSMKQSRPENSLFRPMNSLFRGNRFPVPRKQIPCSEKNRESPQTVQIAVRFLVALHQNGTKQAEFRKIPCYFPCSQGILPLRIG